MFLIVALAVGLVVVGSAGKAAAWSGTAIDAQVDASLEQFKETKGAGDLLKKAEGVLVFPKVFKAGFGIGGEYGEGALRIKGKTVDYYSTAAASIGFQLGAQKKTIILAFMKKSALDKFQNSTGWKIGADASVAVIAIGADGSIDTASANEPIVAFVLDQKGLMYNLTLEGAKITKMKKQAESAEK
ncbi:MAG: YSC84-related protein [Candidatus Omnitrophota bacterium]